MMQPLEQSLLDAWPAQSWKHTRLLVAVSGGADSVALLRALVKATDRRDLIHVAHFNHQWRGEESDADEQFVFAMCSELALQLISGRACDRVITAPKPGEQAARMARYAFLTETAYSVGARYVVTAHTASDRIETMLHNLCRGTGLAGVSVPTRFRAMAEELVLVRPMLGCTRLQVIEYLSRIGQAFREDSSNLNAAYKRNYIRHRLLPLMRDAYGEHLDEHLLGFSEIAEDALQALRFYAEQWLEESLKTDAVTNSVVISSTAISTAPWSVIQMALEACWKQNHWPLQSMTRAHWLQIRELVTNEEPSKDWQAKLNLPGNLQLSKMTGWIRIAPLRCREGQSKGS